MSVEHRRSENLVSHERGAEPIAVRIAQAVELTGICRSTIYELIKAGALEKVKVGRSTLIPYHSLKRLLDR